MKKILALMCCAAFAICCLTACGGKDMSDSPYLGKWEASTAAVSGFELPVASVFNGEFSITLNDDGKVEAVIGTEPYSGKWDETESGIVVSDLGNELEFKAQDDNLVLEYEGMTLTFVRSS